MAVEVRVPNAGESITDVQIAEWLRREGDRVERDEPVVEIETDKASMQVPAPASGVLARILKAAGESAKVGEVIAHLEEAAVAPAVAREPARAVARETAPAEPREPAPAARKDGDGRRHVMPAAARAASTGGVNIAEVAAGGPGGRVLKEDVLRHAERGAPRPASESQPGEAAPAAARAGGPREEEIVPMSMLRRRIAERLVEAQKTTAHLTTFNEIDLTAVLALRKEYGDTFEKKYGVRLGFMSFFVKAAIEALKQFPAVNGEIRGNDIVYKNYYDIGVAVSTDRGLMVPVVRDADRLSFAEVEKAIADLATRARDRKIAVEELQGGTFTITNGGVFGSLLSTPILNPPQSAILGLHAIQERPVVRDGQIVVRSMMYVALSYDHRIIDGRESVTFLRRIKECVENPARMLLEA